MLTDSDRTYLWNHFLARDAAGTIGELVAFIDAQIGTAEGELACLRAGLAVGLREAWERGRSAEAGAVNPYPDDPAEYFVLGSKC